MEPIEKIKKRTGHVVDFQPEKIKSAIEKATLAVRGKVLEEEAQVLSARVLENVQRLFGNRIPDVESIQDQVERVLMEGGFFDVARAYILYRERRRTEREHERQSIVQKIEEHRLNVTKRDGQTQPFEPRKLERFIRAAVRGYEGVIKVERLVKKCIEGVYEGIPSAEIARLAIMTSRAFVEEDPSYDIITTRLFLFDLYREVVGQKFDTQKINQCYRETFATNLKRGVELGRLSPQMLEMDLEKLAKAIDPERDQNFRYRGIQTLYDRYLMSERDGRRLESPQAFWMRVSMGLALAEQPTERTRYAIQFYDMLSSMRFVCSTPTLFHAGTTHPQLSSCYITKVDDSLEHIFKSIGDNAQLSKWSGGLGNDWTHIRAMGAPIKSTGVESQGVIPFLKIANDTTAAINRSGKRRGATCAYLENWHLDIEDFLDLRRNTGDERRRTHDMNTAVWIPDLFMKRVLEDGPWTLFSPHDVPDLHDTYGASFEQRYTAYEARAEAGEMPLARKIKATDLWRKMVTRLFETGHPWLTFKDPCNVRSPQDHVGVVHSSNLCCMTADQRVVTKDGLLTVGELYERGTPNIVMGRQGPVEASNMLLPRPDAPIVKIITKEGYNHKVTPDHKVWVVDRGWVEAQDLQKGDKLEIQQTPNLWGKLAMEDEAYLCGLIAGDGTFMVREHSVSAMIDVWSNEFSLLPEIEQCVARVLEKYDEPRKTTSSSQPQFQGDQYKKRLTSAPLAQILAKQGFSRETKHQIPDFIWKGNRDTVAAYLKGLFLSDGTVQGGEITTCSLASKHRSLLEDVQILLANFGAKSSLNKMRDAGPAMLPDGCGGEKEYYQQELWRLLVTSIQGCKIVEEITQLGKTRDNPRYLMNLEKEGYKQKLWATFEGLEPLANEDAYCLQVYTDEHSWTVNGLITKNTEITLNTSAEETAVCNLASVNLSRHIVNKKLDLDMIKETVATGMRMLDNVIDINFYPTPEAKSSNLRHRPVGLGIMGFQDALFMMDTRFDSNAALDFADESMEMIAYSAILASTQLAAERGTYGSYQGSKWDRGILPQDTLDILEKERGLTIDTPREGKLDWTPVREAIRQHGMRNSNCMAIAPTATISNLSGCFPSIEPIYKNLYVKSNMSGEFTVSNYYLIEDLKARGLWNTAMLEELKVLDGNIQQIAAIPEDLRQKYKTAFEVDAEWLIRAAARRGKWIDQSQSLNIFLQTTSGRRISDVYQYAWKMGLKTTYYLRTLGASSVEKSTVDINRSNNTNPATEAQAAIPATVVGQFCDPTDPTCEACQ
ncbi:MAG: ribonucleoside-diphosphate reductase subunit alpha [Myxococcales bacterium]|nr:ribonucleoside-diphosphate reductase subunit alpha [Myxococcales bacterium]